MSRSIAQGAIALAIGMASVAFAVGAAASDGATALAAAKKSGFSTWTDRSFIASVDTLGEGESIRTREVDVKERNDPDGGHHLVMEFDSPADVQGTIYLNQRPRSGEAQEWLWSPQSRKGRRLAPGTADETQSGAELSIRDLSVLGRVVAWSDADADVKSFSEEVIDGRTYDVLAIAPKTDELPYSGYRLWLAREDGRPLKLEIAEAAGKPAKLVEVRDFQAIDGHATPLTVEVTSPSTGRKTIFRLRDVRYDKGISETEFSLSRLNRGR